MNTSIEVKRPAYRSYESVIKHLISAAHKRVRETRIVATPKPVPKELTSSVRNTVSALRKARRQVKHHEEVLKRQHLRLSSPYDDEDGSLEFSYDEQNRRKESPDQQFEQRKRNVEQCKVKAILDTIDMTPKQAKSYLLKLETELAKI